MAELSARAGMAWLRLLLPSGGRLPDAAFAERHRWVVAVITAHLPVLFAIGVLNGQAVGHVLLELLAIAGLLVVAVSRRPSRMVRAVAATTALVGCSTVLVHLTGGVTESHFHFFIVVPLITVYQQWTPFLVTIGWVVVHHAVVGTLAPEATYGTPEAISRPVLWAGIHGVYVVLASLVSLVTWRLAERERLQAEGLLAAAPQPTYGIGPDGRITFVNRALDELVDHHPLVGVHHHEALHGAGTSCALCDLVVEGEGHDLTGQGVTLPDGRRLPVQIRARPVVSRGRRLGTVVTFWDVSHDLEQRRALEDLALTDGLTGLANRTLLRDRMERAVRGIGRTHRQVGVLFIDLDRFKDLNDTLGHAAGDQLLRRTAERILSVTREDETVARVGGDEFVVVAPGADVDRANGLGARILAAVTGTVALDDGDAFVTASIGVASTDDRDLDPDVLLANADLAMYGAKARGGGQAEAYHPDLRARADERVSLGAELHRALSDGEFEVHYQPSWDVQELRITGAEALVRWRHPVRGLLLPGAFLGLAEQMGLIVPIGRFVIESAVAELECWHREAIDHVDDLVLAINLSVLQLREPGFVDEIRRVLERASFSPRQLTFEVTESLLIEESDEAVRVLEELRDLGIGIAIDDFGTGFSSLSMLRRLPVDTLKIDRAFVTSLGDDPENQQVVSAIVELARGLSLSVVAEGVELPDDLLAVRALRCDRAQGFGLARPAPASEMRALLRGDRGGAHATTEAPEPTGVAERDDAIEDGVL